MYRKQACSMHTHLRIHNICLDTRDHCSDTFIKNVHDDSSRFCFLGLMLVFFHIFCKIKIFYFIQKRNEKKENSTKKNPFFSLQIQKYGHRQPQIKAIIRIQREWKKFFFL